MNQPRLTGLFGKLPAHGDFVHRDLPANFTNLWDEWLQRFVGGSQEQLGENWLDIYLTSPIWRFVLSPGVIDEHMWAGVLLPSVDRVGRYFPFSVVTKIQVQTNPLEFISLHMPWYEGVEELCLRALDGQIAIDALLEEVNSLGFNEASPYYRSGSIDPKAGIIVDMDFEEQSPAAVFPYMLEAFISSALASYSVWATSGSERLNPCAFVCQGLPQIRGVAAMMDGQWEQWHWQQPYKLDNL